MPSFNIYCFKHSLIRNPCLHPVFISREVIVADIRIHAWVYSERPLPGGGAVTSNIFMTLSVSTQAVW